MEKTQTGFCCSRVRAYAILTRRIVAANAFCWALFTAGLVAQQDWPVYGGDPGNSRYSTLKQINRSNIAQLKAIWVYHTGDTSDGSRYPVRSTFESTPLVIDGVMYVTTPFSRVIALNP